MSNGLNISKESDLWQELESPLSGIDAQIAEFARAHGMGLTRNHHNWPSRLLQWSNKGIQTTMMISHRDSARPTYDFSISASQSRREGWFSRMESLKEEIPGSELELDFGELMTKAFETAEVWSEQDLTLNPRFDGGAQLRRKKR